MRKCYVNAAGETKKEKGASRINKSEDAQRAPVGRGVTTPNAGVNGKLTLTLELYKNAVNPGAHQRGGLVARKKTINMTYYSSVHKNGASSARKTANKKFQS